MKNQTINSTEIQIKTFLSRRRRVEEYQVNYQGHLQYEPRKLPHGRPTLHRRDRKFWLHNGGFEVLNSNLSGFMFLRFLSSCYIVIVNSKHRIFVFRYEWRDGLNSVQMSPDVSLPQFVVIGHRQRQIEVSLSSGNYSRLLADVQFTRSMGYYMIQVYIPSSLIVVMSWVSFWLNRGAGNDQVMTFSLVLAESYLQLPPGSVWA